MKYSSKTPTAKLLMLLRSDFDAAWILAFSSSGTYKPRNALVLGAAVNVSAAVMIGSAVKVSGVSVVVIVLMWLMF